MGGEDESTADQGAGDVQVDAGTLRPEQAEQPTQFRSIDERESSGRVRQAILALPERQRLALTLFHFDGLSQIEVGNLLGISDEAVESLLARARRTLKAALKSEWQQLLSDTEDGP